MDSKPNDLDIARDACLDAAKAADLAYSLVQECEGIRSGEDLEAFTSGAQTKNDSWRHNAVEHLRKSTIDAKNAFQKVEAEIRSTASETCWHAHAIEVAERLVWLLQLSCVYDKSLRSQCGDVRAVAVAVGMFALDQRSSSPLAVLRAISKEKVWQIENGIRNEHARSITVRRHQGSIGESMTQILSLLQHPVGIDVSKRTTEKRGRPKTDDPMEPRILDAARASPHLTDVELARDLGLFADGSPDWRLVKRTKERNRKRQSRQLKNADK